MKSLLIRLTVLFTIVISAITAPVRAADLAERVPADALAYVGWQGIDDAKGAYEKSRLKAILDNSSLPKLFSETIPELVEQNAGPDAQPIFDALSVIWHRPTIVYVGKLEFAPNEPPKPHIAIVCDAGKDAAALEVNIKQILKMARPRIPVAVKRVGDCVMFLVGDFDAAVVNLLAGGKPEGEAIAKLSDTAGYKTAIANVQKGAMFTAYANLPAWVELGNAISVSMPGGNPAWGTGRDALNLAGLKSAALTFGFDERDWGVQAFVGTDGSKTGLLAFADAPAITDTQLKMVPQDATWFAAFHFDASKVFTEVMNIAGKMDPETRKSMENGIKEANKAIGIDVQKDFLDAMGDNWVAYTSASVGGSGVLGLTVVNVPRDAAKFAASLDAIEKFAAKSMAPERDGFRFGPQFAIRKSKIGGVDVHHVPLFMVSPSWSVHEGKFYASLYPNAISGAVDAGKLNTSILDNPGYVAARKRLNVASPTMLSFFDTPKCAAEGYTILQVIQTAAETFAGDKAPATLLPPLHKIMPELTPAISATWTDAAGLHAKSLEPFPASMVLGGLQGPALASPALAVAVLLPSLGRAREISNRSYDSASASGIMKSANVWANDHGDKFPEHLAQLVAAGYIGTKQLVSKRTGTEPLVLTPELSAAAQKDWHAIEKQVDEHCDWVYLGKGRSADVDASEIVLYAKPNPNLADGFVVGWSDAHASFERYSSLETLFRDTNEKREKLKLPLVDVEAFEGWAKFKGH